MKLSWLVIPGLLLAACNQKAPKNDDVETNGSVQLAAKDSGKIEASSEGVKLTEPKVAEPKLNDIPESEDVITMPPTDVASPDATASEPAVTTGAPKAEEKEIATEDALKHIAPGLVDFACKKSNPTTVACQPVDAKKKTVTIPTEAKVEWFASDGTEASLKAVKAELKTDPNSGSSWIIPLDEFLSKPVLARVTRDKTQADIYVTPDD